MYTQCRGCGEVFVVDVDHLVHARGHVRCNLCGTVFDGMETLSADKPHEDEDLLLHDFDNAPPLLTQTFQTMHIADAVEEDFDGEFKEDVAAELDDIIAEAVADSSSVGVNESSKTNERESEPPEFAVDMESSPDDIFMAEKRPVKNTQPSNWLWSGLFSLMLLGLLWQAQAAIASGQIKLPEHILSERWCQWFSCAKITEAVDLNAISLLSRKIRPHPGRDEALIISASMINANENKDIFPALEIILSDLDGQVVAMRRFVASEYVPEEILKAGFVANTIIPINLEIVSPGENAVAFEIGFVQP